MKYNGRDIIVLIVAIFGVLLVFQNFGSSPGQGLAYSEFLNAINDGRVKEVTIAGPEINGTYSSGQRFTTYNPETSNGMLIDTLRDKNVTIVGKEMRSRGILLSIILNLLPILILFGLIMFMMRQSGGGGKNPMSFGKSKARMLSADEVKTRFSDVAGADEAKQEVGEVVDFLRDPTRFQRLGGKMPKGILMVGPPGTGKTLLAKAIAGEAGVPFFTISGSDFMEMFVGVGAARVRDMFEQAKKHAPCIIFIDEIDAVGRHRGSGLGGGHDEREQTLNQMLVEMDGFGDNSGIIIIAATNRVDVLDPALLRPGRFDRQVTVPLPDIKGREAILKVHLRKVPIAADVDILSLAKGTPGFSGADLANLVNEGALFAARENKNEVGMDDMENAKDKIYMGAERRSLMMTADEMKLTAYHEAGHAIVAYRLKSDPVYKVTIIPRGRALGVTWTLPENDKVSNSREWLNNKMAMVFGGRIAEEIIFGYDKVTTGAMSDIQHSTDMARKMVTKWGLSDKVGFLFFGEGDGGIGGRGSRQEIISNETAQLIDEETRRIVEANYARAKKVLEDDIDRLHRMADILLDVETIDAQQVDDIMNDRELSDSSLNTKSKDDGNNAPKAEPTPPTLDFA